MVGARAMDAGALNQALSRVTSDPTAGDGPGSTRLWAHASVTNIYDTFRALASYQSNLLDAVEIAADHTGRPTGYS